MFHLLTMRLLTDLDLMFLAAIKDGEGGGGGGGLQVGGAPACA